MNQNPSAVAYTEIYAADGPAAVAYFRRYGFTEVATATGADQHSTLLEAGPVRVIVTTPAARTYGPVSEWLARHGDAVADIALYRDDVEQVLERASAAGLGVHRPGQGGPAVVQGLGALRHTMLDLIDVDPGDPLVPGRAWSPVQDGRRDLSDEGRAEPLREVDHLAVCLPPGELAATAELYRRVWDMEVVDSQRIEAGPTAMDSLVLRDALGVTYVMAEPDPTRAPGQVDEFVKGHGAAGIQHIAWRVDDLVEAVTGFARRGVEFPPAPPATYYEDLAARFAGTPGLPAQLPDLQATGIVLDVDHGGTLLQIFTRAPHQRGLLFYELIERRGATGFGERNVVALFEARERDLARLAAAS
ncbi:VOC family protein [Nonomuraea sp. NPDC050310]|uniref:VOC family protein n=1 Tax=Nonomuraea sp. NPDC050310 TaxID=3154935 RepID=UPI00340C40F6